MPARKQEFDKGRADVIRVLMEGARDRFARRVVYQWRVCFSCWTALGLAIGYFATVERPTWIHAVLGTALAALAVFLFARFVLPWAGAADQGDKETHAYWEYQLERLLGGNYCDGRPVPDTGWIKEFRNWIARGSNAPRVQGQWWQNKGYWTQCMITLMFAGAAIAVPALRMLDGGAANGAGTAKEPPSAIAGVAGPTVAPSPTPPTRPSDWVGALGSALGGAGTIVVACLALWGPSIHRRWFGPRLRVRQHRSYATYCPVKQAGVHVANVWMFCFQVVNERRGSLARRVEVRLVRMEEQTKGGEFRPLDLAVPLPFIWSPSELGIRWPSISTEQVFDFCGLVRRGDSTEFGLQLQAVTFNLQGAVRPGGRVRYYLEVHSDDTAPQFQEVVEVAWDGNWSDRPEEMSKHLTATLLEPVRIV